MNFDRNNCVQSGPMLWYSSDSRSRINVFQSFSTSLEYAEWLNSVLNEPILGNSKHFLNIKSIMNISISDDMSPQAVKAPAASIVGEH